MLEALVFTLILLVVLCPICAGKWAATLWMAYETNKTLFAAEMAKQALVKICKASDVTDGSNPK